MNNILYMKYDPMKVLWSQPVNIRNMKEIWMTTWKIKHQWDRIFIVLNSFMIFKRVVTVVYDKLKIWKYLKNDINYLLMATMIMTSLLMNLMNKFKQGIMTYANECRNCSKIIGTWTSPCNMSSTWLNDIQIQW